MAKLWHCTPSEFLEQDQYMIDLHAGIYTAEIKKIELERKRAEQ